MGARAVLACVAVLVSLGLVAVSASAETVSFTKAGCEVWTAPADVLVHVEAVGAAGGTAINPGKGDGVSGSVAVGAGKKLDVCVDQGGGPTADGNPYFAGGGWSGIIAGTEELQVNAKVVAAGGGGTGISNSAGGDAGKPGGGEYGGGAGTLVSGGAGGGEGLEHEGTAGSALKGGAGGGGTDEEAGGGGGGYFGGGGGGSLGPFTSWGGGGGSDFCGNGAFECATQAAAGTVHEAGAGANEPHVTLTTSPLGAPTVTKVTATSGPATGDKVVTITGTNFKFVGSVKFGTVAASKYTINEAGTEIGVVTPAQQVAGTVDVTVTTVAGASKVTTKDHYKYLPVITKVEPNTGPVAGGGEVTVFGVGFKVGFNALFSFGTTMTEQSGCENTRCIVIAPTHAVGKVDVRITVNGAISAKTKADLYTYK
jgi:hypothetical protein